MKVKSINLTIKTSASPEFIDITNQVAAAVAASGVADGLATVYSKHTTAAIRINEHEAGVKHDFAQHVKKTFPPHEYYRHNDMSVRTENIDCDDDRCDKNGHSHLTHFFLGTSETIPIVDSALTFGRWQRVFLIELCSPRQRDVVVQIIGE